MTEPLPAALLEAEWLEADGLGGFASGTVAGIRTRRYHALLLAATTPPTGRMVLVNGIEAWLETQRGRFALSAQRYTPDVVWPDGQERILGFQSEPWPRWAFRAADSADPAPLITGEDASRDVPIHVISGDPDLLAPFAAWGFTPGMRPPAGAPAKRMDAFRDFFLEAFSAPPVDPVAAAAAVLR